MPLIGFSLKSALGSLADAGALDRQVSTAVVSQNWSDGIRQELMRRNPMPIGAVDYFALHYVARVISVALSILQGKPFPPAVCTNLVLLMAENLREVYRESDLVGSHQRVMHLNAAVIRCSQWGAVTVTFCGPAPGHS